MPHLLFTYANDQQGAHGYLRALARERKAVKAALDLAEQMGLCKREFIDDASAGDIISAFQRHEGEIVLFHYGGHAGSFDLLLQDAEGSGNQTAGGEGLIAFLGRQRGLQAVMLNGCHTEKLAEGLIAAGVPLVIGTGQEIVDQVATRWAARFYQGLGVGLSVQRAFDDAVDEIRMSPQGRDVRGLYLRADDAPGDVPWRLHVAPGKEDSKQWGLTRYDPLLGLPAPPEEIGLPHPPFLFFRPYERAHASVFFGRAQHIRLLYDRVANPDSPSLILLHGQSGSGKSSLFEAGLAPRLETDYVVRYCRRDSQEGLTNTLKACLDGLGKAAPTPEAVPDKESEELSSLLAQLEEALRRRPQNRALQQQLQGLRTLRQHQPAAQQAGAFEDAPPLLAQWMQVEARAGRPLVLILDQVEEVFTQATKAQSEEEWQAFVRTLGQLFSGGAIRPQGKLILGFRKEYFPEVEKALQQATLPRSSIFLPTLAFAEIEEVVLGLTSRQELREHYHLIVEPELPALIASELLQQPEAAVAPVLQIMLTNMWEAATTATPHEPRFTVELYRRLKAQWWQLGRFVLAQIAKIAASHPAAVENGLLLDMLYQHTTAGGTAHNQSLADLEKLYGRLPEWNELLGACEKHLLLHRGPGYYYRLSHDTLAPIIRRMYQESGRAGQRARRILEGRVQAPGEADAAPLDRYDLAQVHQGLAAMRALHVAEQDLLTRSDLAEVSRKRQRIALLSTLALLALAAIAAAIYAYRQQAEKLEVQMSLMDMRATRDTLTRDIQDKEQQLSLAGSQLLLQTDSISRLADSAEELSTLANRNMRQAQAAERRFRANQQAADALAYLQEGKKYEALQAAVSAYRQSPESPAVAGALLKLAYDTGAAFQPMNPDYHLLPPGEPHPQGMQITSPFTGFEVTGQSGNKAYEYPENVFVDKAGFIQGYADRAYFQVGQVQKVVIWAPLMPAPAICVPGRTAGLSPIGQGVAWASADGQITVTAGPEKGAAQASLALKGNTLSIAASPDGRYLLVAQPTELLLLSAKPLERLSSLTPEDKGSAFRRARFSPGGRYLVAAQTRGVVGVYSWQKEHITVTAQLEAPQAKDAFIVDALLSPDERYLLSIDNANHLYLWDWRQQQLLARQAFPAPLHTLAFSPDGRYLALGCANGMLYTFDWRGASTSLKPRPEQAFTHTAGVTDIAFWPGPALRLAVAAGRRVHCYEWDGKLPIWNFDAGQAVEQISFSPDGHFLWLGTAGGLLSPLLIRPKGIVEKIIQKRYIHSGS